MLRDYQANMQEAVRDALRRRYRRPVLVAPTGSGKTHIATSIVRSCQKNGARTLFLAPRRELIYQTLEKFEDHGIESGMIMAGEAQRLYARNQVASFDTLHSRAMVRDKIIMPSADVVLVDEAHLSMSKTRLAILNHYSDSIVIGLTATPARGDGRGLGEFYDIIVNPASVRSLIDQGYLVEPQYYAPSKYDLTGVKQTKSDYVVSSLDKAVDQPKLIGDIYDNWARLAPDKSTVVFCVSRKHSRHVCAEFRSHGITAEHVDGETPKEERADIFARVKSGEVQVLCNVFVASYGLDLPILECCILARPTKNISLYIQTCGRCLRPAPGKTSAIIIDHTGAIERHGFLDDEIPWTLDGTDIREEKKKQDEEKEAPKEITCKACGHVYTLQRECPKCGYEMIPKSEAIPHKKADLVEVTKTTARLNKNATHNEKREFFGMLKHYAASRGYNRHWASHQYRNKFGVWPNKHKHAPTLQPSLEVMEYIKTRQAEYARGHRV